MGAGLGIDENVACERRIGRTWEERECIGEKDFSPSKTSGPTTGDAKDCAAGAKPLVTPVERACGEDERLVQKNATVSFTPTEATGTAVAVAVEEEPPA